jgi:hypothetical protein
MRRLIFAVQQGQGGLNTWLRDWRWLVDGLPLGVSGVVASAVVQALLVQFGAQLYFATFLPAVFLVGLLAGTSAAAIVILLTVPLVWWAFIPPFFEFNPLVAAQIDAIMMFLFLSLLLIFFADVCRAITALWKGSASSRNVGTTD